MTGALYIIAFLLFFIGLDISEISKSLKDIRDKMKKEDA